MNKFPLRLISRVVRGMIQLSAICFQKHLVLYNNIFKSFFSCFASNHWEVNSPVVRLTQLNISCHRKLVMLWLQWSYQAFKITKLKFSHRHTSKELSHVKAFTLQNNQLTLSISDKLKIQIGPLQKVLVLFIHFKFHQTFFTPKDYN